jgi:hypothetical protein
LLGLLNQFSQGRLDLHKYLEHSCGILHIDLGRLDTHIQ